MAENTGEPHFSFKPKEMIGEFQKIFQAPGRYWKEWKVIKDSEDLPVGQTPKEEVWRLNKMRLYRYTPVKPQEELHPVPVLLVYALINRPYIYDLRPGCSFVEFMLEQGFDVYMLDWGSPGPEDSKMTFDDYPSNFLPRVVRKMLRVSGAKEFSMIGYCIGALFATMYAALYPESPMRNLVLLTAPLDFTNREDSIFGTWFNEKHFDVDKIIDNVGNVPEEVILSGSKLLKPVENYVGTYSSLWESLDDDDKVGSWQALNKWVHDGVPFAGEAFRQYVKDYIQQNKLVSGEHCIQGRKLQLQSITKPVMNIVAKYDHIVPISHSASIMDMISSEDKTLEIIPAGHVGVMAGRGARYKLWPKLAAWLQERSGN